MKLITVLSGLMLLATTSAQALDVGIGAKAGTVGTGVDLSVALTQTINARVSLTRISYDFDETLEIENSNDQATLDSTLDLDFGASALLFDWYVFDGTFHVTAGMMKNDSKIKLEGTLTDATVIFDGTSYDVASDFVNPTMSGEISAGEDYEPYVGFGWGRKAGDDPGLAFSFEVGVVLMDPEVDLSAPTHVDPNLQSDLDADVDAAESAANDDLSALEAWPIISFGLNYAF